MEKLTELVRQYKQNKDNKLLDKIFKMLNTDIKKRVELVYRRLKYYKIEKEDIKQELYIKILTLIESYDPKEPFENYLFSCLKYWHPKLSKEDVTHFKSLYDVDEETGEVSEINIEDKNQSNIDSNMILEEIFKECNTENEQKICEIYLGNPDVTTAEIGKKLGMTKQNISLILKKLRKRLKKYLSN